MGRRPPEQQQEQEQEEQRQIDAGLDQALMDPYPVLGIARDATLDEIKKAYFAKVREHPPERDPAMFKRIRVAYDALRTPEARAATDLFLLHPFAPHTPYKRPPKHELIFHEEDWLALATAETDLARSDFRDDYRDIDL